MSRAACNRSSADRVARIQSNCGPWLRTGGMGPISEISAPTISTAASTALRSNFTRSSHFDFACNCAAIPHSAREGAHGPSSRPPPRREDRSPPSPIVREVRSAEAPPSQAARHERKLAPVRSADLRHQLPTLPAWLNASDFPTLDNQRRLPLLKSLRGLRECSHPARPLRPG